MNQSQLGGLSERILSLSTPLEPRPTDVVCRVEPLTGIRAVLLDVYGTLVISASGDIGLAGERNMQGAFDAALEAAGIEAPDGNGPEKLERAIRAVHTERKASGVEFPEVNILDIWAKVLSSTQHLSRMAVEYECRVNPVWPMPGLAETLEILRRQGFVLGIVSNAQFYTPLMLEGFLGSPLADLGFDPRCCAWSYRLLEAKPSTRIYEVALAGLHRIRPCRGRSRRSSAGVAKQRR
jgi:putative hydrolase of the HAD superfamily